MTKGKKIISALLAGLALSATVCAAPRPASEQIQVLAQTVNSGQEGGWFVTSEKDGPRFGQYFQQYAVRPLFPCQSISA